MLYDIIGDLHGHADALTALLTKLGYRESGHAWRHPERTAIFVGDFIDRGPKQVETVMTVRRMVDAGNALAIMGNHELNAIAWFSPDHENPGDFLRPHFSGKWGEKNRLQHERFLAEVEGNPSLHKEVIDWFLTLPLWLELPELQVAHACWHPAFMNWLAPRLMPGNRLSKELMPAATKEPANDFEKDSPEPSIFKVVEVITKGIEVELPSPHCFKDKDGHTRTRVRTRWWDIQATTYRRAAMLDEEALQQIPDDPIPEYKRAPYTDLRPLFVGHYWESGTPTPFSNNVACVDYSVANNGKLVAYRWNGECVLNSDGFVWV
jgi:hypothetical protein